MLRLVVHWIVRIAARRCVPAAAGLACAGMAASAILASSAAAADSTPIEQRARQTLEAAGIVPDRLFAGPPVQNGLAPGVTIVATFGLADAELQALMADARRAGFPIVLRGVWRGSLPDTSARLKRLAGERGERAPAMTIDPPVIRRLGVSEAPALVLHGTQTVCVIAGRRPLADLIARAAREWPAFRPWADAAARALATRTDAPGGIEGLTWPGEPPACRVRLEPPPIPLAEPDLAAVMRDAVLAHDWRGELARSRDEARRRVAEGPGLRLPRARAAERHGVDPTVVVQERIVDPTTGRVLAEPGQRLNPMEHVVWHGDLVIIDATDPAQVRWAEERRPAGPVRTLITRGDALALQKRWGRPVQWLPPELADRLRIAAVPSVVRRGNNPSELEVETYVVAER